KLESLRPESRDEPCSLVNLECWRTAWVLQADARGVGASDFAGSVTHRSPDLPRTLSDDLGWRLDRPPILAMDRRARQHDPCSTGLWSGGGTNHICIRCGIICGIDTGIHAYEKAAHSSGGNDV